MFDLYCLNISQKTENDIHGRHRSKNILLYSFKKMSEAHTKATCLRPVSQFK